MSVGKRPAQVRRRRIVEEVKARDEAKKGKQGENLREVNQSKSRNPKTAPGRAYKNPPVKIRETSCCLDKERELPQVFKQCFDCPKLTEAGSPEGKKKKLTGVGPKRGGMKNRGGVKNCSGGVY